MEFLADPNIWIGLVTLIVLEVVLGIDNLVFIAILADKLPPHQRHKARIVGLSLALIMRILLLFSISWIVTLTRPLFQVADFSFSGRDLILILGGAFLLAKGTMELHERLEGDHKPKQGKVVHAVFWQVIVQIVVLDAVFSLDSVITAVGMVNNLWVMITAVCVAMAVMMAASKPLMTFVSKHPTVVILCLGFLLMIGFSLIVEGFGFHLPKGYLYAAIGFSVLIEAANQIGRLNRERRITAGDMRERTSDAILRLLGGRVGEQQSLGETADVIAAQAARSDLFKSEEKDMIRGVLTLAERPVVSIMTPRTEIDWLDVDADHDTLRHRLLELDHSRLMLAKGKLDSFLGVAATRDLLRDLLHDGKLNLERSLREPLIVHESATALQVMEQLRKSPLQMAVIVDEYGTLQGITTPTDILEAIAGEFPDEGEESQISERAEDGSWLLDGAVDVRRVSYLLDINLVDEDDRYSTVAGYILWRLNRLPEIGERVSGDGFEFEIVSCSDRNIEKVRVWNTTLPEA
ncbi:MULTISPECIES: TerC family protein [unclassified Rhizobium]|uniref:TerC family protein n=1 Tax=unclassified Rhizobium TaxID=2613769 RepID=UPI00247B0532|nr:MULTISPECIES: TerC family protein [unclassified Rhizobium]MDH7803420.1 CBS domain containing-hemolysin-like protein [Rhizobium sp. AN70]